MSTLAATKKKATKKRAPRTPPFENYPEWSSARFFQFLRSALRAAFQRYPPKWQALEAARREYKGPDKRQKHEYRCAKCKKWHKGKDVSVDHIVPAGSLTCWEHLVPFVVKLFCAITGLQVLCKGCHHKKTQEERSSND